MISSNLPFSQWNLIFKDAMTTAAAIDRLVHHSIIIELNVASYRLEAAKKNQPGIADGGEPPEQTETAAASAESS